MKNKKTLALFLCAIMIATTFCSAPLSVSAEENENIYSQTIATEMATEGATESVSEESTLAELTDTVNQNTAEVATEPYSDIDTYTFSKSQKTLKNESSATEKAVTFSNSPIVLGVGEAYTFSGDLLQKTLATTAKSTYKWSSNNTAVLTVNSSGKITAKKAGEATINVVASNGKKATCTVTVKNAPTKVTLNKTAVTLGVGETFDLNPTLPSGTASYSIKFTSNSTGVATVNATSGLITAKKAGTAVITATTYNGKKATCTVTVKNAPTKVTLNKTAVTLGVGETFDLNPTLPSGTASYSIKFTSNSTGVATVNATSGLITAKKAGTAVITATTYNGKKATCTVTVKNAPTKVTLNKTAVTLGVGETFDLNPTLPSGTASYSIKFTSNSTGVATVNATSGLITAKKAGTAVITATTYNGKKATCTVTVKNAPTKVTLNKTAVTLGVGETFDLNPALPSGTASYSIKFTSNSTGVATVNATSGLVTAKKEGTAVITATTYNGKKATCKVTVKKAPTMITLNKSSLALEEGETFDLNAILPDGTASYIINFTSSDTNVVVVNTHSGLVTAKKAGTAVITATTYNGKKVNCKVTVKKKNVTEEYINEVLRFTNEERKKEGLPALAKRTDIDKLAAIRAKEISTKFSHTRPNGESCFSLVIDKGIAFTALGENIAAGQESPKSVVNAWMNSDGHRKNILSKQYTGLGVGCYIEDDTIYWVQMFIG